MSLYSLVRPRKFADVLGQEDVVEILKAQTLRRNWHNSYLFYGPSGTGKTSTARILASSLNCSDLDDGEPCGSCQSCEAIAKGSHWDVLEVDGARFSRVEDARELAYRLQFAPLNAKHKVIILDECHRLTDQAWDVFLKPLEDSPPYLVIILCSTQAEKIPMTIKSRCLPFPFQLLSREVIKTKLRRIADMLQLEVPDKTIEFIAVNSAGNLRWAENLLEEVICKLWRQNEGII